MSFFLVLLIILILSISISLILNFKSLESIVLALCSIIIFNLVFTLIFGLNLSVLIILILIGVLFIISIYYSLKTKVFLKRVNEFINSPALWLLLISTIIYTLMIRDAKILSHDDFSFWAYSPKIIHKYNGFAVPNNLSTAAHPYGLTIYYAFITKITGYSFDVMLIGKWMLFWTFLLLPFSKYKTKETPRILLYSFIVFAVINHDDNFHQDLFSDIVLYSIWSGLIGYYYISKSSKAKLALILCSLIIVPQLKAYFGIILTIFMLIVLFFDNFYKEKKQPNKNLYKISIGTITAFLFNYIIEYTINKARIKSSLTFSHYAYTESQISANEPYCNLWDSAITTLKSNFALMIFALMGLLFILCLIAVYKKQRKKIIILVLSITSLALIILAKILLLLDDNSFRMLKLIFINCTNEIYLNLKLPILLLYLVSIITIYFIFIIPKELKKYFLKLSIIFLLQFSIIITMIFLDFARKNNEYFIKSGIGLGRYLGVGVYFLIFIILIHFIGNKNTLRKYNLKYKILFSYIVVLFVIINIFPPPLNIYNYKLENMKLYSLYFSGLETIGNELEESSINKEEICVIYDIEEYYNNPAHIEFHMQYFMLIPKYRFIKLDKTIDTNIQINSLKNFVQKNNITKIFYYGDDEEFELAFSDLFLKPNAILGYKLYNVVTIDSKIKLERIDRLQQKQP